MIVVRPRVWSGRPLVSLVLYGCRYYRADATYGVWWARCPSCGYRTLMVCEYEDRGGEDVSLSCWAGCDGDVVWGRLRRFFFDLAAGEVTRASSVVLPSRPVRIPDPPVSVGEGGRNRDMFAYACALRRVGFAEEEIRRYLDAANASASPPLPDREVRSLARSAMRYRPSVEAAAVHPGALELLAGLGRDVRSSPYDAENS